MNRWSRQIHRWTSVAFTLGFLANTVIAVAGIDAVWVGVFALVPLLVLLVTGLWLFAIPWLPRRDVRPS